MTKDRTNNNNEGFYNFLQHFIQIAHPTLFHLINDLKVIETRVSAAYYNLKYGTSEATKRLPIYMARDRRITYLKKDLESTNISLKSYMIQTSALYTFDKTVDAKICLESPARDTFLFNDSFSIFKMSDLHLKNANQIRNYVILNRSVLVKFFNFISSLNLFTYSFGFFGSVSMALELSVKELVSY